VATLTASNTAIVLDSTADFPAGPDRYASWRIVPLYVRFGDESFRDYVDLSPDDFYARLRTASALPTTSQPTPADFLACYEELAAYDRVLSLHIARNFSGTVESARLAAGETGGGRVRVIDTQTASAGIAMLALAIQRRLERGRRTTRWTPSSSATGATSGSSSQSTRSSTWPGEGGSGGRRRGRASCSA
jgi:DegV family protein with EDD domain